MGQLLSSLSAPPPDPLKEAESLREQARKHTLDSVEFAKQSQAAYQSGRHDQAKSYSQQKSAGQAQAAALNQRARSILLAHHNSNRPLGELDLHGLLVKEAKEEVENRIAACRKQKVLTLVLITGQGHHSEGGRARIKPEVMDMLQQSGMTFDLDTPNAGCITLHLDTGGQTCVIL